MLKGILLPSDYVAPLNLEEDAEKNSYIIDVGFRVHALLAQYNKSVSASKNLNNIEDLLKQEQEKYQSKINSIQKVSAEDIKFYKDESEKLKVELRDFKKFQHDEMLSTENKLKEETSALKIKLQSEINALQEELINQHNKVKNENSTDNLQLKEEISKLKSERDEFSVKLAKSYDIFNAQLAKQEQASIDREKNYMNLLNTEKEQTKKTTEILSKLTKPSFAQQIGVVGEEMIENWMRELFNNAEVTNQSQLTAKGDLHVKINNKTFLIEIKNKTVIFKTDIDKFIRDVSENANIINGGLFISINTPAIPNKGDFSLEYIGDIPVIYLYVSDKSTLRVAIKTLLFLNNKSDAIALTMTINNTYNKINAMLSNHVGIEKSINDLRSLTESNRKEIKNLIINLEELFDDDPSLKFEVSTTRLEFRPEEINIIRTIGGKLSKPKMSDYVSALNCTLKYLQDRGGAAGIKNIISGATNLGASKTIYGTNIPNVKIQL
jgi:hypothetical protein